MRSGSICSGHTVPVHSGNSSFPRESPGAGSRPVTLSGAWEGCGGEEGPTTKDGRSGEPLSAWQIDDKQLRGYLSELRPVTIVFVNLLFKDQDKAEVIGSAIQEAFVHISSVLRVFRGQINKVFMFDKVNVNYQVGTYPNLRLAFMPTCMGEKKGIDTFNLETSILICNFNNSLYGAYPTYCVPGTVLNTSHTLAHFTLMAL